MKRSRANSQPPTDTKTLKQALLFGSALSLLLLFGFLLLLLTSSGDRKQADAYRHSPRCLPGTSASASLTPCVFLAEQVVSKRREEGSRGTVNYFVKFRSGQAAPQEAEVIDSRCWDLLAAGDAVTAQTWQGHVMTVAAHNRQSQTADNPLYVSSTDRELFFLLTPLTLFFVTATFLAWKKALSSNRKPAHKMPKADNAATDLPAPEPD